MDKALPLVSVIMPVYNADKYVGAAIQSILNQTYTNFELIIINDGSTDNSDEVIKSFTDERIKYHPNDSNQKIVYCRNKALDLARGKYIAFLDSDDLSAPERLELQVNFFEENSESNYGIVSTFVQTIDIDGNDLPGTITYKMQHDDIMPHLLFANYFCMSAVMLSAETVVDLRFNPDFPVAEDYDLYLRIVDKGYKAYVLDEELTYYRVHGSNITHTQKDDVLERDRILLKRQLDNLNVQYDDAAFNFYFLLGKVHTTDYYNQLLRYSLVDADRFLSALVKANSIAKKYNPQVFNAFLYSFWRMFFIGVNEYNSTLYWTVKRSPLYKYLSFGERFKFFIKCTTGFKQKI